MLKIRLNRIGRRNRAHYRIVVAESCRKRDGKTVDMIGFYSPKTKEVGINFLKLGKYLRNGAQITRRVYQIVKQCLIKK